MAHIERHVKTLKYQPLIMKLVNLEAEANALGLFDTAHRLREAKNTVGWEVARKVNEGTKIG